MNSDVRFVFQAYEALVEEKGKNVIYLRLSSRCVSDLGLKDGDKITCMVILQIYAPLPCCYLCQDLCQ